MKSLFISLFIGSKESGNSPLSANTPPCENQATSRAFSFAKFLSMLLLVLLSAGNVWGYDGTFVKITSVEDIETGLYVVVGAGTNGRSKVRAMSSSYVSTGKIGSDDVTITDEGTIISNPKDEIVFSVTKESNGYIFKNYKTQKYLYQYAKEGTRMNFTESSTIAFSDIVHMADVGFCFMTNFPYISINSHFKFNPTDDGTFTNMGSTSVWSLSTNNRPILLYKLANNSTAHKATFNAGSGTCATSFIEEGSANEGFVFPTAEPSDGCKAAGWIFAGWKKGSAQSSSTTEPTLYLADSTSYLWGDEDQTYYAVYKKEDESCSPGIIQSTLSSGDKVLLIYDTYSHQYNEISSQYGTTAAYVSTPSETHVLEVREGLSGNFALYDLDYQAYLTQSTTNTGAYLNVTGTVKDSSSWTIAINEGAAEIHNVGVDRYLRYNYNGGTNPRFGLYTSNNDANLYKLCPYIYNSNPSCAACSDNPTLGDAALTGISSGTISVSCPTIGTGSEECHIIDYGFVWNTSEPASISDGTKVQIGNSDPASDSYSRDLEIAFSTGTTYHIKAYATNGHATVLSSDLTVTPQSVTLMDDDEVINTLYVNGGTVMTAPTPTKEGYVFGGWFEDEDFEEQVDWSAEISEDKIYYSKWVSFSVTGPVGDIVFITSAASQTVRSQEAFHVTGTGLAGSTVLTFSDNSSTSKFVFKAADGSTIETDENGDVNADFYVYYTPSSSDLTDGLDIATSFTVGDGNYSVTLSSKQIIGRHLPDHFVIATRKDNKWWALPADKLSGIHTPVEIAVDDDANPSIAYTSNVNTFGLHGQSSGEYVKMAMHGQSEAPLFGNSGTYLGKGEETDISEALGESYLWELVQINTSITNAADAKYNILCKANCADSRFIRINGSYWGLYTKGTSELRILSLKADFTEAEVVEWGEHSAVIEVDAGSIDANKVVAHIGATASDAISLTQTLTSVKGSPTIYNYTVNFGNAIDFSANSGNLLHLEWKNGETTVAGSNVIIPKIITASMTSSKAMGTIDGTKGNWDTEVHILPGATLRANAGSFYSDNVTINELHIYPGATINVTTGTLIATTLIMRNGWTRAGEKSYDVSRLGIASTANFQHTNAYADWYIDYDQYYPVAVPFPVSTSAGIEYVNIGLEASAGVRIRYYDGEKRATNVQDNQDENWVEYNWSGSEPAMPDNLTPGVGYAMTARRPAGKAFSIVRMNMSFTDEWTTSGEQAEVSEQVKNIVSLGNWGYGSEIPFYAQGWNFIANPYMALFNAPESDEDENYLIGKLAYQNGGAIRYATIPTEDFKDYEQYPIIGHGLKPFSAFFVQAATAGDASFVIAGKSSPSSMPALYRAPEQVDKEIEAFIELSGEDGGDMMGLVIGDKYSANYDINADLTKMMGSNTNSVKTYMLYNEENMAYVAINSQLSSDAIPVIARIPQQGEYTYSLNEWSEIDNLEALYLIDYQTSEVTNLLYNDYSFYAEEGTYSNRFAINAVVGSHKTPTGIDALSDSSEESKPTKFIYHDKIYILYNGVIYDVSGKQVTTINTIH